MNSGASFQIEITDILLLMDKSVQQGMSISKLLESLELPADLLSTPNSLIDFSDCWRIMIANQNIIQEESHLMSSRPLKKGTLKLVFSSLSQSKNLFEALSSISENFNVVHGGDYNFVTTKAGTISYLVDDKNFHYSGDASEFGIEFALIRMHCALSILAGKPLPLVHMLTKRKHLPSHQHHLLLFNTTIIPDQAVYELVYDASQLDVPLTKGNHIDVSGYIYEHYLKLLNTKHFDALQNPFVDSVLAAIVDQSLKTVFPSQGAVAKQLNMSIATLRRKLKTYNLNYQQLLDQVNGELAGNLLQDKIPPIEIAERLGYSDVRSFKRAFRRWQGMSPFEYTSTLK